jgi:hypothetical protein
MADRLMNEHAGVAGSQDDGHFSGGSLDGFEEPPRLLGRFPADSLRSQHALKIFQADAAAPSGKPELPPLPFLRNGAANELDLRPGVLGRLALGIDDGYGLDMVLEENLHLLYFRVDLLTSEVSPTNEIDLVFERNLVGRPVHGIEAFAARRLAELGDRNRLSGVRDRGGGQGSFSDLFDRQVVRIAVAGFISRDHPNPQAEADAFGRFFDNVLFHVDKTEETVFSKDLGELAAA